MDKRSFYFLSISKSNECYRLTVQLLLECWVCADHVVVDFCEVAFNEPCSEFSVHLSEIFGKRIWYDVWFDGIATVIGLEKRSVGTSHVFVSHLCVELPWNVVPLVFQNSFALIVCIFHTGVRNINKHENRAQSE